MRIRTIFWHMALAYHWSALLISLPIHASCLASSSSPQKCREQTTTQKSNHPNSCSHVNNEIDYNDLRNTVLSGRVYQQHQFLSEAEVQALLGDISKLEEENAFQSSGLSNLAKGNKINNQNFGDNDRSTCPVPWWKDSLLQQKPLSSSTDDNMEEMQSISDKLNQLRHSLSIHLNRPTMQQHVDNNDDNTIMAHECYYSKSKINSYLSRHMDERHEELKGRSGWLLPSRRSVSWLVYLSDEDWHLDRNGGALRSFPQDHFQENMKATTVSHDGNLQIGWLINSNDDSNESLSSIPVFLDSWYPVKKSADGMAEPHCILYTIQTLDDNTHKQERIHITNPWSNDAVIGISIPNFIKACAERDSKSQSSQSQMFLRVEEAQQFTLLEDRMAWEDGENPNGCLSPIDTVPERGSLVLFDSVLTPHEVTVIKNGTRIALAGWFHEQTQPFPDGIYG